MQSPTHNNFRPLHYSLRFTFRNTVQLSSNNHGLPAIPLRVSQEPDSQTKVYRQNIMHGYCLKLSLFDTFLPHTCIMTPEFCLGSTEFYFVLRAYRRSMLLKNSQKGFSLCVCARQLLLSNANCFREVRMFSTKL